MVNPEFRQEPAHHPISPEPVLVTTAGGVKRSAVVAAAVPLVLLAGIATAYGFLEGKGRHPSLKLGGAFLVAGLATITLLLARSMFGRNRPELRMVRAGSVETDRREVLRMVLAFLSLAAALIHFAVIEQHFTEYWLYGAFFVAVGLFELVWALLVMTMPSRLLYAASAAVNAATVAAYVVTRTVGLLVGPAAHQTEAMGFGDLTSTAFEVALVVGSLLLLSRSWGRARLRAATSEALLGVAAIAVVAPTVLALFSTVGGSPFVSPAG